MSTAEATNKLTMVVLDQPSSLPRTRAKTRMKRPSENETKPIQSIRRVLGSRDSAILASVMMMATAPMGTLTKKIQRHPMALVMAPPTSGPTATAPPVTAPKIPKAVPRSFPWKAWAIRASEVANMMAPPTPCTARDRFSMSESVERPQVSEARENTASPTAKTMRRPYMSPTTPAVSRKAARVKE